MEKFINTFQSQSDHRRSTDLPTKQTFIIKPFENKNIYKNVPVILAF